MTHEELDQLVAVGLGEGVSARSMAVELQVKRGVIDRAVKRVRKAQKSAEAATQEAEDPSTLEKLIADCDVRIARWIAIGNALEAGRLTRVREGLVSQRPAPVVVDDPADWSLLSEAERSVFEHCIRKANGEPPNPYWTELLERVVVHNEHLHPARVPLPVGHPEEPKLLTP